MAGSAAVTTKSLGAIRPPIRRDEALSLSEQIAAKLTEAIVQGRYEPGDRIHEVAVSERFQVSRGPVREALRILEKEGLVQIQPRRGAVVTKLTIPEVEDVFEIRGLLLGIASFRAAKAKNAELAADLRRGIARLQELTALGEGDEVTDAYLAEVQELNLMLCARTGSERLTSIIYSLLHQTLRYSRLGLSTRERRTQSVANWSRLADLIEAGDAEEAQKQTHILVERSRNMAVKLLSEEEAQPRRN